VLEYLRDGVLSVAEQDAWDLDVSVLRWLKREMGFYCIELMAESQEVAFAVGGCDDNERELVSMERYDVASDAWSEAAPMPTARASFGLCGLDGELYVTGGLGTDNVTLTSVERYDPRLDTWSAASAMPHPRFSHYACAVGDAMYVLGGIELIDGQGTYVSSVLKFDSRAQSWSEMAPMPAERSHAGACVVGRAIYIFGGRDDDAEATSTTYCFSTETNTWTTLSPMPTVRQFYGVCVLAGLIYVMGGQDRNEEICELVHRFEPEANSWSEVAPMTVARSGCGAFVFGGSMHVVGGWDGEITLTSFERYCVISNSWLEVSSGNLGVRRLGFGANVMWVEEDFFDSLKAKAKRARR
jgi:N-acetylneuraminic acid mutarotase